MLLNSYFSIKETKKNDEGYEFLIALNPNHQVYRGHFPGDPICPGVCSIQTIRECAESVLNRKLTISSVSQCRFLELLTPSKNIDLLVKIALDDEVDGLIKARASVSTVDGQTVFLDYKGEYSSLC